MKKKKPIVWAATTPLLTGSQALDDGEQRTDPCPSQHLTGTPKKNRQSGQTSTSLAILTCLVATQLGACGQLGRQARTVRQSGSPKIRLHPGPPATRRSSTYGCATGSLSTGKRGNSPPMNDGDTHEFAGLAASDDSDDQDDRQ